MLAVALRCNTADAPLSGDGESATEQPTQSTDGCFPTSSAAPQNSLISRPTLVHQKRASPTNMWGDLLAVCRLIWR
jgi:hypothetical protein